MKRKLATQAARSRIPRLHIPLEYDESPKDMASGSTSVGIMDLPSELKQAILSSIPPAERRHLRLVNKTMLNAVATSMRDVLEIAVSHTNESSTQKTPVEVQQVQLLTLNDQPGASATISIVGDTGRLPPPTKTSTGGCRVLMTTVNPYNGTIAVYDYKIASSSLPFLLQWAGIRTESLSVTTASCFASDGSRLETVRRVFKALNSEDACPNLTRLNVASCRLVFDNAVVLGDVLGYVTKRQEEAKAAADRPLAFLRSLSLIAPSNCCDERIIRLQTSADGQASASAMYVKDQMMARQMERIARLGSAAASSAFSQLFRRGPPIQPPAQPMSAAALHPAFRFSSDDDDDDFFEHPDDDGPPPHHAEAQNRSTRNLLQQILDQCHGLKILNVDSLLMTKSQPVVALHYPSTLTQLKTTRLGKTPGELSTVVANCPRLRIVDDLSGGFTRDDADIRALVSLTDLRALSIVSAATGDEVIRLADLSLAAFGEHPYGPHIVHPWTQITSITLNYATGAFLQLLSRGCPTLQEVRIQVLANTPAVTEETIGYLSDLPALRVLIVEDKNEERTVLVGDALLDAIAGKCPHLEQLCLFPCSVALLSLPRLLRECPRLRSVTLRSLSIALETLDCLVMVRSLAHDLCDRKVATVVQVREITGEDYTSVGRIIDGLGAGTVMAMSSMTDSCVHDLEICASCCFDAPEARANARRVEQGGRDTCPRSFILAQRRRPHAAIVFSAPPSLKSGGESGRRA